MENRKKWVRLLFAVYLLAVLKVIVFKYPLEQLRAIMDTWERSVVWEGLHTANFTPFKTIRMYIEYSYMLNSFENVVGNVLVFVPFGFLLPHAAEHAKNFFVMLLCAFGFVLGIELFQLLSAFGAFDVDDIILNCFGAVLGYMAYCSVETARKWYQKRKRRK